MREDKKPAQSRSQESLGRLSKQWAQASACNVLDTCLPLQFGAVQYAQANIRHPQTIIPTPTTRYGTPWWPTRACWLHGLYSSVVERQSCKLKVLGSIPSGGLYYASMKESSHTHTHTANAFSLQTPPLNIAVLYVPTCAIQLHTLAAQRLRSIAHAVANWPCGLMDKALVFGTKDCRFESCQGHYCCTMVSSSQSHTRHFCISTSRQL